MNEICRRLGIGLALSLVLPLIGGCNGGDDVCEPGKSRSCPCPGTETSGVQVCNDEGTAWKSCNCTAPQEDGGDGDLADGGTDSDAGADGESSPPAVDSGTDAAGGDDARTSDEPDGTSGDASDGEPSSPDDDARSDEDTSTDEDAGADACSTEEICDGTDNDCDGKVDESCPHRVFVTDQAYDGKRGGPSGLDALCGNVADEAGLEGEWKAIVSTSSKDAKGRITIDGTVYNLNDEVVADNESDMWDGTIDDSINYSQYGEWLTPELGKFEDPLVWTATDQQGVLADIDGHCEDWSTNEASGDQVQIGDFSRSDDAWIADIERSCDDDYRFYCIDGQTE